MIIKDNLKLRKKNNKNLNPENRCLDFNILFPSHRYISLLDHSLSLERVTS